jgi:ABC-type bacteriocin/lantibiotic exporter with double-glycine peptidase domain
MYFIWQFINNNGFTSKGYEFTNIEQLKNTINKNEKKHSLLLMKGYDEFNGFTISFVLLLPFLIIKRIFSPFGLLSNPIYHWVLLDEIKENKFYISDPFLGRVFMKKKKFNRLWTKYGLVISKSNQTLNKD